MKMTDAQMAFESMMIKKHLPSATVLALEVGHPSMLGVTDPLVGTSLLRTCHKALFFATPFATCSLHQVSLVQYPDKPNE